MRRFIFSIIFFASLSFLQAQQPQEQKFIWMGAVDSDWNNIQNWQSIPPALPPFLPTQDSIVIIKKTNTNNYPKLNAGTNALAKEVRVASEAKLDIAEFVIKNASGKKCDIKLIGTLLLKGTSDQRLWFESSLQGPDAGTITLSDKSTVLYYETSNPSIPIWEGPYYNLIFRRSVTAGFIEVKKNFTIEDADPPTNTLLVVNAKTQKYEGDVIIKRDASFEVEIDAKFNNINATDKNISFKASDVEVAKETKASNIKLEKHPSSATKGTFKFLGNITLSGATATDGKLEVSVKELFTKASLSARTITITEGVWESEKKVTVSENISLSGASTKWSSQEDIEVLGNISANGVEWLAKKGNITVKGNVVADNLQQSSGKVFLNGNGAQSISAKKLKELGILNTSNATWEGIGSKQTIEKTTNAGSLKIAASADLEINELLNSATFMVENATLHIGKLENNSGLFSTQASSNITIGNLINKSGASFNSQSPITLSKALTNKGLFIASSFTLNPDGNSMTIEGNNNAIQTKFSTLTLENVASKELIIKEKITVTTSLKLSGTGEDQVLTIKGEGEINLPNAIADEGQYLVVHTNIPIGGNKYTTKKSRPEGSVSDIDAGKPENWIFDDCIGVVRWHGGKSDDWGDIENWRPQSLPSKKTDIIIPSGRINYPLLKAGDTPQGQKITIENAAWLDLDTFLIEATSSTTKIINNGKLKLQGTSGQKAWFEESNSSNNISIGDGSLVQYYGNSNDDVWGGPYQNLTTSRSLHADFLTVEKIFTITPDSVHPVSPIIIDANIQNYRDDINISSSTTFKGTGNGIFKKILGTGYDITFEMHDISVESSLYANKLILSNAAPNSSFIAKSDVILTDFLISSASDLKTEKKVEAKSIIISSTKWSSYGDITVLENINTATASWQAVGGIITAPVNVLATGLVQRNGKLILNGTSSQKLVAKKIEVLEIENTANSDIVDISLDTISTFLLKKGSVVLRKNASFIKEFTNTGGKFDAVTHKAVVSLEPVNTFKLQAKAKITDNAAETANTDTKFYQLHCKNAGGKSLEINGAIEVLYDISGEPGYVPPTSSSFSQDNKSLILEGSSASKLNIIGNGQIWFNKTPPYPKAKKGGKFLHVAPTVEIRGAYYRVRGSTYDMPSPRGWLFEEYAKLLASLAITGTNEVCLIFNTPIARPPDNSLKITSPSFPDMISIGVEPYPKGSGAHKSDKWIYKFASTFTPALLLEKNALLSLGGSDLDFIFESSTSDVYPHKQGYISDIGLNLLENILAKNTQKIKVFDGSKQLPFVNTSILTDIPIDSNIILHIAPSSNSKYWVPLGVGGAPLASMSIDPPPSFSLSLSYDAGLSTTQTKTFIVSSTVPQFKKTMGVEFMFSYDGLPCARLQNKNNIFSFALWKFGFISAFPQRGGVSIFNNVINLSKGQETTIEITTKKGGPLNIEVMTIDGSIVKTIASEYKSAGTYNYFWNGFNSSGSMVGRGLYFVRIVGADIDEVRKVLIIKD